MALCLRDDCDAAQLTLAGRQSDDADQVRRLLALAVIEDGPMPAIHGVVRWRIIDLCSGCGRSSAISISQQTLSRELRAMGYRKLSARPRHHAQAAGAVEAFKKTFPASLAADRAQRRASIPAT